MHKYSFCYLLFLLSHLVWGQQQSSTGPALPGLEEYANLRDFTISSNGNEAFFTLQSPSGEVSAILCVKKRKGVWSKPFVAPFSGKCHDLEPFLSPDNLSLYFVSNRPLDPSVKETKDYDIWQVSRKNLYASWEEPRNLGPIINTDKNEFYPSVASNKNIYFTSDLSSAKGKDDIFISRWDGTTYTEPVSLSESINSDGYEFNAFIAPDESFIIFSGYNRQDGLGSGDLYISYRHDGVWEQAVNMGDMVNSNKMDYCPFVDVKSKNLYFTSKRSKIQTDKRYGQVEELLTEFKQYENGQSRLYKINIESSLP